MTIKLIVFDMDGVLIHEHCYASKLFEKKYGIPDKEFWEVMKVNKMAERTRDNGPNFELFGDLLKKYNVKISEEKFWDIWLNNFEVKQDVVGFALSVKKSGGKIGILSDNPLERAEYLRNLEWIGKFDHVLFSCDVGATKNDHELFEVLIERSDLKSEEIFFTDDDEKNVEVARSVGINAMQFTNLDELKNKLIELGVEVE